MNKPNGRRVSRVLFSAAVACGISGVVGCATEEPFDVRDAQKWETSRDTDVRARPHGPLPTTAEDFDPNQTAVAARPGEYLNVNEGPPIPMTLREIIHRAVANNLDVRVAAYDTAIDQTRITEAEGAFDPTFFSDISTERVDKLTGGTEVSLPNTARPNTNNISQGFPGPDFITRLDREQVTTFDLGFRQNTSTGARFEIKQEVVDNWFSPARTLLNPFYENDLVLTLTQPLLSGFGTGVNRARIDIAVNNQRISLLDFRKTVEETVLKIEQVYWQLVQSNQDVDTLKRLIAESEETTRVLINRGGLDATSVQIFQSRAETAGRRSALAQTQAHVYDLSSQIKQLMNDPRYPVSAGGVITPADSPSETPLRFNLDDQIETAMQNRLELGQQQVRIESAQIARMVGQNQRLPTLNLQLQGTVDGLAHSITQAFSSEGNFDHLGGQIGLNFEMPIGNRTADAIYIRSELQRMQAIVSYGALVKTVSLDVVTAARAIDTAWVRLNAARASTLEYRGLLDRLQKQLESTDQPYTFEQVFIRLQDQQQLAAAEQTEHQALNDYNFAIANLEKAKGTILRYNNVIMEQEQLPYDMLAKPPRPFEKFNNDREK